MSLALLAARLGKHQAALEYQWMKRAASPAPLDQMVARRVAGEPLQYILGEQPFGPLTIKLRPPVLIPRPETEHWTLRLVDVLKAAPSRQLAVLDLGTGTGCIPLLLCHLLSPGTVRAHGVDVSPDAVSLANENAVLCGLSASDANVPRNIFRSIQSSFLNPLFPRQPQLTPPFDIITSNPPYVSWAEYVRLPRSVKHYEDPKALFGGPDGLDFYRAIAALVAVKGFLNPGALVVVEVGDGQAERVRKIFHSAAQVKSEIWLDPWNKMRTVIVKPIF
ncbi:S-adenosyl-L-methionine-dependent methyltransferase [Mycena pura]|uniref:S-adenosyl-L-methionine-dependent methyltransferase n=1 Tax=Mycena pura TaxID=153505 RepID=A0AAD6VN34_9AGAR|nr:S-adenosyl-L-methionine-dependent methyltransferase [Mycena pura]